MVAAPTHSRIGALLLGLLANHSLKNIWLHLCCCIILANKSVTALNKGGQGWINFQQDATWHAAVCVHCLPSVRKHRTRLVLLVAAQTHSRIGALLLGMLANHSLKNIWLHLCHCIVLANKSVTALNKDGQGWRSQQWSIATWHAAVCVHCFPSVRKHRTRLVLVVLAQTHGRTGALLLGMLANHSLKNIWLHVCRCIILANKSVTALNKDGQVWINFQQDATWHAAVCVHCFPSVRKHRTRLVLVLAAQTRNRTGALLLGMLLFAHLENIVSEHHTRVVVPGILIIPLIRGMLLLGNAGFGVGFILLFW